MALSRQSLSPTANLLRNSRLFSLPNPLPRPAVSEASGASIAKSSDSATLPYPTHQAIATTKSSLARGDWGLKRPLPSKSSLMQVSDPVLRIKQLDTIEHVTDFDSAADHVRTREKWLEMGVPMMKGLSQIRDHDLSGAPPLGAFEIRDDTTSYDSPLGQDEAGMFFQALKDSKKLPHADQKVLSKETWRTKRNAMEAAWHPSTYARHDMEEEVKAFEAEKHKIIEATKQKQAALREASFVPFAPPPMDTMVHNTKRWKHEGPWLPGMGANDFAAYLDREISKRKTEFHEYLVQFVQNEIYTTRRLAASKSSEKAPMDIEDAEIWHVQQEERWRLITREEIDAGIRALRKETVNDPLGSKLVTKLILPFLRLPAIKFKYKAYSEQAMSRDFDQYSFDQEAAPLSTHPSAGLGYLRTKSYLANHPILGPQSSPAPVPARVLQPRTTSTSKETFARLGVAGFVANDQFRSSDVAMTNRSTFNNVRDVETIDIDTEGGKKILVQPMFGSVTNDGRIHIKLVRSVGAEVQVARGELDDIPPVRESFQSDPLKDLGNVGKSGVKELDEQSSKAQQLHSFLDGTRSRAKGKPGRGSPGAADALRSD